MKVFVIIGVYKGVIDDVEVEINEDNAISERDRFDAKYNIHRDKDGYYESGDNDVIVWECEI